MAEQFDAIVVGGGSAGLAFAKGAAGHGARVALIERGPLGGTCVNRGCVPKKLLWAAASTLHRTAEMQTAGLTTIPPLDFGALKARIDAKIETLRDSHAAALGEAGVTLICGTARIDAPEAVSVAGRDLTADRLILATGARPSDLDIDGAADLQTSREVLGWTDLPQRLVILGAGYIGCEFASIFAAFGVDVTLIEPSDGVLDGFDPILRAAAEKALSRVGVTLRLGARPERVSAGGGGLTVHLQNGGTLVADRVVNATGRTPNVDRLGPISGRLERAESGTLAVDEWLQTSLGGVHAIGDAADRLPLTPVATGDGAALAEILYGGGAPLTDLGVTARAAFLLPPVAQVGVPSGAPVHVATLGDGVVGPEGCDANSYRVGFDDSGRMTGFAMAGPEAAELTPLMGGLIAAGGGRADLRRATGIHPSFAEELLSAHP